MIDSNVRDFDYPVTLGLGRVWVAFGCGEVPPQNEK
jgi:hypothetical protein